MIRVLAALLLLSLSLGLSILWYNGELADYYGRRPDRTPLITTVPNLDPFVIAHRGHSYAAPENTLAAIRAAINSNFEYVEMDIRLTADAVPVLLHDVDVDRTTDGEGDLTTFTFAELRKLDAGSWFGQAYAGERVPTLEEALAEARGKICVFADVKGVPNREVVYLLKAFAEQGGRFCLLVNLRQATDITAVEAVDLPPQTRAKMVATFEAINKSAEDAYRVFRRYWPGFPQVRAIGAGETPQALVAQYPQLVALEVSGNNRSEETIRAAHDLGVLTFTRATIENMEVDANFRTSLAVGVDGFFVDHVDLFHDFVARFSVEEAL